MGILQEFIAFAETLEGDKRDDVENVLRQIISSYSEDSLLTPEQQAEDDRRFNDPNPKYATQSEVNAVCGRIMPS
jgi:hypothetical protein